MIKAKSLIKNILISSGVGLLAAFFTGDFSNVYDQIARPALAPPAWLFPVVWTILYVLMGISAYIINEEKSQRSAVLLALATYYFQLAVNFVWPFLFFKFRLFKFSFIWIVGLWLLVLVMIIKFYKINKTAAYLQLPYLIWLTFAAYLNFSAAMF